MTVMLERIKEKKNPFKADNKHFHHKLLDLGFFHTEAVFLIYVLQALLVTFAYIFRYYSEWFLLSFYAVFSGTVLVIFFVAEKTEWRLNRRGYFDKVIKGKLRVIRDTNLHIRLAFQCIEYGLPLLLISASVLARRIPGYLQLTSIGFGLLIILARSFYPKWTVGILRIAVYMVIPFMVYFSEKEMAPWVPDNLRLCYHISFIAMIFLVIMTLRFTRRAKGFKSSPTDFLILFIALVGPNLPDAQIQSYHLGLMSAKIIILFFSYEVLFGELREKTDKLIAGTLVALLVIALKGTVF